MKNHLSFPPQPHTLHPPLKPPIPRPHLLTYLSINLIISPHIPPTPSNSLPDPIPQPILNQARENHQILGRDQQLIAEVFPRAVPAVLARREDFPLVPDAGDGPEEEGADVAGDGGREGIEGLCVGADGGNGRVRVEGEEVELVDGLCLVGGGGWLEWGIK